MRSSNVGRVFRARVGRAGIRAVRAAGFTLVELLVVVAVIALLIGVLLPALAGARAEGQAAVVTNNLRSVAQGVAIYVAENGVYPPSYVYARADRSYPSWNIEDQLDSIDGSEQVYWHWSWALFSGAETAPESFESPKVLDGGAPRTNPGPIPEHWVSWQQDVRGTSAPGNSNSPTDLQVPRVAYVGNEAIFPRNKFNNRDFKPAGFEQQLVRAGMIERPSDTILATEVRDDFEYEMLTSTKDAGGPLQIKSHRPISPFYDLGFGFDWSQVGTTGKPSSMSSRFVPPPGSSLKDPDTPATNVMDTDPLQCVARHHPGGDSLSGGSTIFVYADGHAERKGLWDTARASNWEWGDRF